VSLSKFFLLATKGIKCADKLLRIGAGCCPKEDSTNPALARKGGTNEVSAYLDFLSFLTSYLPNINLFESFSLVAKKKEV